MSGKLHVSGVSTIDHLGFREFAFL